MSEVNEHEATYSPEDNKLRLYFSERIDRAEWDALKAAGWAWTMKQASDMCAHWTPEREDQALDMAGYIGAEESTRDERAADRAERFGGYLDKRLDEARGHAAAYEAGPAIHGHQSQARAEASARKHDRQAVRALNQWDKAEYWQSRTAGVINNALNLDRPAVRARRIKELKKEIARKDKTIQYWGEGDKYAQRAARWSNQLSLRLSYEQEIYAAQVGDTFEALDIQAGGLIGSHVIHRVNKSKLTGEVNSIAILGTKRDGKTPALVSLVTTQFKAADYTAPTAETLAKLKAERATLNAAKPKPEGAGIKLLNPTDDDAERLQALLNEREAGTMKKWGKEPQGVLRLTQAQYSAHSKGAYRRLDVQEMIPGGDKVSDSYRSAPQLPACVKLRGEWGIAPRVIVLTDKPQKALPAELFHDPLPDMRAAFLNDSEKVARLQEAAALPWSDKMTDEQRALFHEAQLVGLAYKSSMSQFGLSKLGLRLICGQEVEA